MSMIKSHGFIARTKYTQGYLPTVPNRYVSLNIKVRQDMEATNLFWSFQR